MTQLVLKAFANADDVHLVWTHKDDIPGCLGFAIQCRRGDATPKYLSNRIGFEDDKELDAEGNQVISRSSRIWPFQRYDWTDHAADLGDRIAYRVVARVVGADGKLKDGPDSGWSETLNLTPDCGGGFSAYFNRGFVLSQFMARYMKKHGITLETLKDNAIKIGTMVDGDAREFLGGNLREAVLGMLDAVRQNKKLRFHAALYELEDQELIGALAALGPRAELVLSNGSVEVKGDDQNKRARKALLAAGVLVHDRFVSPGALGHNKFAVIGTQTGAGPFKPAKAWTGSTNWTPTGLCTQLNNGVMIENEGIAKIYEAQFQRLAGAKNAFPKTLVDANSAPSRNQTLKIGKADVWFSRLRQQIDIAELVELVKAAKQGVFFIMFQPGNEPVHTLLDMQAAKKLYVRGVATRFTGKSKEEFDLLKADPQHYALKAVQATGTGTGIGRWAAEGTASQFTSAIGHAITHSKVLVIDPLGADPIVVTGSHNFSASASKQNDENFIVVRGHRQLAIHYAVNAMQTYNHYRWRAYLAESKAEHRNPFQHLTRSPAWQKRRLTGETKAMLGFWLAGTQ